MKGGNLQEKIIYFAAGLITNSFYIMWLKYNLTDNRFFMYIFQSMDIGYGRDISENMRAEANTLY